MQKRLQTKSIQHPKQRTPMRNTSVSWKAAAESPTNLWQNKEIYEENTGPILKASDVIQI